MVDDPALPLRVRRHEHFFNDLWQRRSRTLDRAGQRVAAQCAKPHAFHHRLFAWQQPHPLIVHHDQRSISLDNRANVGQIERYNGDVFQMDVLPDIQFGPVAQREYANTFTFVQFAVVNVPQLRPLILRVPLMLAIAEAVDTFFRTAFLFIATGTAERSVKLVVVERLLQRHGFHDICVSL